MAIDYHEYDKDISLVQRICILMREKIRSNEYPLGSKLPNETDLARMFKVSRGSIRAALQFLEQSGLVIRRRGIGTFVSKEPMLINNLSMNFGISQVIESIGAKPGTAYCKLFTTKLTDPGMATRLEVPLGADVLCIERVRTADGKKVAFTQDFFEIDRFYELTRSTSTVELEQHLAGSQSLYAFLNARLDKPIHHAITHILPIQCGDSKVTELLGISANSVLLKMEQVDYTTGGEPIWMAVEYHISDMFTFSVYRTM